MPSRRVYRQVRKQQSAGLGVFSAVLQHDGHAGSIRTVGLLDLPIGHGSPELHHARRRLREVNVQRIDLLHDGQLRCLALPNQRAFSDQGPANAARNRRGDRRITEVDTSRLHVGFGHGHVGLGLPLGGNRVGVFLFANGVCLDQGLVALCKSRCLKQVSLGFGLARFCAGAQCCVRGSVNREQRLPGLDITALAEQSFLQNTRNARPNLRNAGRFKPTRQLGDQTHITQSNGNNTDFSGWWLAARPGPGRTSRRTFAATGQHCNQYERGNLEQHFFRRVRSWRQGGSSRAWHGNGFHER